MLKLPRMVTDAIPVADTIPVPVTLPAPIGMISLPIPLSVPVPVPIPIRPPIPSAGAAATSRRRGKLKRGRSTGSVTTRAYPAMMVSVRRV